MTNANNNAAQLILTALIRGDISWRSEGDNAAAILKITGIAQGDDSFDGIRAAGQDAINSFEHDWADSWAGGPLAAEAGARAHARFIACFDEDAISALQDFLACGDIIDDASEKALRTAGLIMADSSCEGGIATTIRGEDIAASLAALADAS